MKKLLIVLLVLTILGGLAIAVLSYLDTRAREYAETEAAERLAERIPSHQPPTVAIDAFPFVAGVLWDGSIERLTVSVEKLESRGVALTDVSLVIDDLDLDRDLLLSEQKLRIIDIGRASIDGLVAADTLARYAPVPVEISDGKARVEYQGKTYEGTVSVSKHAVLVSVKGMPPVLLPLPEQDWLPCEPEVELEGDHLRIKCSVDELPPAVQNVLGG